MCAFCDYADDDLQLKRVPFSAIRILFHLQSIVSTVKAQAIVFSHAFDVVRITRMDFHYIGMQDGS